VLQGGTGAQEDGAVARVCHGLLQRKTLQRIEHRC
jgi:hypothetical protein